MILPAVHPFLLGIAHSTPAHSLSPPSEEEAWRGILEEADRHRMAFILYQWINDSGRAELLPSAMLEDLKARIFKQAARNLALAHEAASIFPSFSARHVYCAPIRGFALAEALYGDITARPMGDLDLLVRKQDLPEVAETMRALGFHEMDRRPGFAQMYSYTLKFIKERNGWVIVEPHWTLCYPPFADRLDMDAVWKRCTSGRVLGIETRLLSREDLILHLCLHLIHSTDSAPLLWFHELDRFIRKESTDWDLLAHISNESGTAYFVFEIFRLLTESFRTPIPCKILDKLKHQAALSPAHRVAGLLAGNSRADGRESLALFFAIKGIKAKARYLLALLFPSPEFMRLQYGISSRSQIGWQYVLRVSLFAREGLRGVFGMWTAG